MYFHNGDYTKTLEFSMNDCLHEFVHVADLNINHYLYREDPYLFVDNDGIILGLNQQSSTLELFDKQHNLIDKIAFKFETSCEETSNNETDISENKEVFNGGVYIFLLGLTFALVFLFRNRKGKKHEI